MALFGSLASLRVQAPPLEAFATAFSYLDEVMREGSAAHARVRSLEVGSSQKIELADGAFVIEQAYETKPRLDGFFESHRKFIDVQAVIEGEEAMELAEIARMTTKQPYDPERDLIVYEDCADATVLRVHRGEVAIFYPEDVHMPALQLRAGPVLVRKCVVKLPVRA